MQLIYELNENKTFKCDRLVESIEDVLIKVIEEKETVDGEEAIVEKILDRPVLPENLTDVKPPANMAVYPNISPKFTNGEWVEDTDAASEYLETLPKQKVLMSHEQMDELLTYLAGGR